MHPAGANLYDVFRTRFPARAAAPLALLPDGRTITYSDADRASATAAAWLRACGLSPGDRVTVQAPKCVAWLWLYLGCLRAGLVFHPLNDGYGRRELEFFLRDASPRLVVCAPSSEDLYRELLTGASAALETLGTDDDGSLPAAWSAIAPDPRIEPRSAADLAVLLYSSGTTGPPKGAMQSHGSLASNALTLVDAWGFSGDDCLLHALPVYHAHGLFVGVGCTLASGSSMRWLPRFDVDDVLDALPHCTVMMGVPTYYSRLLASPRLTAEGCRSIRLFVSGSAPLGPETFAAFERRTDHRILERYGMTETGMNTSNPLTRERRPGSVGPPLPGIEVRIVDRDDRVLAADDPGNVQVRGPNLFLGYWNRPEATAESFTADGWFRTGDLGRLSDDGYLSIVGRSKDLIISGGLNVYPGEVEQVLDGLPGIAESAVIGVPHPDLGEAVVAVAVADEAMAGEDALLAALRGELAGFKRPKRVFFLPELPRNAMGKVRKDLLRGQFADAFRREPKPT